MAKRSAFAAELRHTDISRESVTDVPTGTSMKKQQTLAAHLAKLASM